MKHRLLVMNGQRIVQTENQGAWTNQKVDKAGALKPGIYNIYMAQKADKSQRHDGSIVHADSGSIYQQVGKNFVMHARSDFDKVPEIGSAKSITYDASGKAQVSAESVKLSRGRTR
ncbi:TPA: conjugal transfer protein TraO [Escherichia coli]|uniref:KfrB domain-containing protein n=3 Tax=root TaxID=1 RepID=A0A2R4AH53_ECOLX|nr:MULTISPECIES: IncP plasmid survival protein KfrB [Pseudomonadota]AAS78871.1 TraO [Cloning vector pLAFR]ADU90763.1 KfrB protein [uncultured bacterium]EEE2967610.1 conjugal transfer protein TraO [Salmonella enterica subsp. enterica serovar Typhimurium]KJX85293.1 putative conjugation protein TraO [Agrobacterium tumefaciens]NTH75417.1 conjugal transfer protein TraO [Rhizobium rhizogenes]BAJ06618.1 TraO [Cloning vector pKS800]HDR8934134.1 conjugal transfer protein TraO [Burkholderia vietnamien